MKRISPAFAAAAFGLAALFASAAAIAPSAPLIEDGPIVVDAADFEGNMLRIPEGRREEFRASYDRVAGVVDTIFVARSLAARAKQEGLDKDPAIQRRLQQIQDNLLADLYMEKRSQEAPKVDLEARARETFKADYASMIKPEEVYVQHILIGLKGRTREMAAEIAKKVRAEAAAPGADFLAVASKYSDDPDVRRNGGDLGYKGPKGFIDPVRLTIEKMDRKGEVSEPIESEYGYHIVKFIDRHKAQPVKFEDVRKKLIEAERDKLNRQRLDALVQEVRNSKTVQVHPENVEKLVHAIDPQELERKAAEAAAAASTAAPKQ
jgi:peptidyl-prolyl cis-trans isomerase C